MLHKCAQRSQKETNLILKWRYLKKKKPTARTKGVSELKMEKLPLYVLINLFTGTIREHKVRCSNHHIVFSVVLEMFMVMRPLLRDYYWSLLEKKKSYLCLPCISTVGTPALKLT